MNLPHNSRSLGPGRPFVRMYATFFIDKCFFFSVDSGSEEFLTTASLSQNTFALPSDGTLIVIHFDIPYVLIVVQKI